MDNDDDDDDDVGGDDDDADDCMVVVVMMSPLRSVQLSLPGQVPHRACLCRKAQFQTPKPKP